jgi:hexosaminidase
MSDTLSLIPLPRSLRRDEGYLEVGANATLTLQGNRDDLEAPARLLERRLHVARTQGEAGVILLSLVPDEAAPPESYTLDIDGQAAHLSAPEPAGLFHAVQTLLQLLPGSGPLRLPRLRIEDAPRFPYRGLHLDVARHFFPVDFIKRYLDLMALHKLNHFHWHLTEDQGWRLEIERFPELTRIGARRAETMLGHHSDTPRRRDGRPYGGFYSQDDAREVVAYAGFLGITVIPEIEMPGHSLAALAARPELSCTGGPFAPATDWGVFEDVYCAGKEATFAFLESVLDEVLAIFPGEKIHIGGDECPKTRWRECPDCRARMAAEKLATPEELQSWFIRRIESFLRERGRRLVGWDEILEGGLAPGATVMSWRGTAGGIAAASQGHDVIMCPGTHCYFDHYQAGPEGEPLAIGGLTTLEKVYAFEPLAPELGPEAARHVLGGQGNVWTEYMPGTDDVERMVLPRLCALGEVLWSPAAARDWPGFRARLAGHAARLTGLGYRPFAV